MSAGTEKILLVDDDDVNNFLSHEIISHYRPDAKIEARTTVKSALEFLEECSQENNSLPDIILVDINMPWLDGWDFIENFEKLQIPSSEKIRLYIYTSSVYYKDIDRGKSYRSVTEIFSKPLTEEMLAIIFNEKG
jgi:CheY-like chemotaxis protein